MGLIDEIRRGTYRPSPGPPVAVEGRRGTIAEAGERVAAGVDLLDAVRDVLDGAARASADELARLIADRPPPTGTREGDALLAGIAEHLAATRQVPCPAWTREPDRFLDRFWFVSPTPGLRAVSLAQAPVALKRRGILWPARSLERV
jgi:hypothetical protein